VLAPQHNYTNLSSAAGLGLIGFNENDIAIDYGCIFFDSFVYASRLCRKIIGISPSSERLTVLQKRLVEEDVKNYDIVSAGYKEQHFKEVFDCVIINSFLEQLLIEIKHNKSIFFDNKISFKIKKDNSPEKIRIEFLKTVYEGLRPGGTLYLSYANKLRINILLLFVKLEIESFFNAFSLKKALSFFSIVKAIYLSFYYLLSQKGFEELLKANSFVDIEKYAVFPDHKCPLKIIPLSKLDECSYEPVQHLYGEGSLSRISAGVKRRVDRIIFKKFKLFGLSPSFIIMARKAS
jgi:SAM-dependent methyltransferase